MGRLEIAPPTPTWHYYNNSHYDEIKSRIAGKNDVWTVFGSEHPVPSKTSK